MWDRLEGGRREGHALGALWDMWEGHGSRARMEGWGWGAQARCGSCGLAVIGLGQTSLFSASEKWTMIATRPERSLRCWCERSPTTSR